MKETTILQNKKIGALVKDFADMTVNFYNELDKKDVCPAYTKEMQDKVEAMNIPTKGRDVEEIYHEMIDNIYSNTILQQHPRSFACVPSNTGMLSWLGDVMTNMYNPHASCTVNGPAAAKIEKKVIRWLCDQIGYPETASGLFVSGGSIANFTALAAARDTKLTFDKHPKAMIYVSDQTHSSVNKGLHMIAFRSEQIKVIKSNDQFQMDTEALKQAIKEDINNGKIPFAVIASAGTTNTGSIDPMMEIAEICHKYNMWMHVDGAYGGSLLVSKKQREKLKGIEYSDSMSWDGHKLLMQTYGCSMVLVRDQATLLPTFAAHPEYLKDNETFEGSVEFWDLGPELTRPARSLKLWLTLQVMGTEALGEAIDYVCHLAEIAEADISQYENFEVISHAQSGSLNFRYIGDGTIAEEKLDEINLQISREITESGYAQVLTTILHDHKVIRMCTLNPETTEEDIHETIKRIVTSKAI